MIHAQPQVHLRGSFARGMFLRAGTAQDYPLLRDIDDDAGVLFERAGLVLNLPHDHEFTLSERDRWQLSLAAGTTFIAMDLRGRAAGFVALSRLGGQPFLAQISVRHGYMRRGIGSALLYAALDAADGMNAPLWLTTYDHLAWNRPFYERHGFVRIADEDCGAEVRAELALERRSLPLPEQRIAMRRTSPRGPRP